MEQAIIQIGNSVGVIIPSKFRKQIGFKKGSKVYINIDTQNNIIISKEKKDVTDSGIFNILEGVNKRYGKALRELAEK
ncbi:hypothetical protein A2382_03245 [Candidatus Woesebacteria bacterium RIFOXYB1_FULL_38_16]|uniref:SpoVT-AbrB domain-containing protein n=1 Tax=Candidatus Woesebacteria bacterium RIFOXYB1_FULL_38_16 TaxID=1802538 RepID=A0A1F8CTV5_9BACT|nr:MAG: hypothetical protein A2191_04210 [Candidatus Woesebacteria bacterium RIFOXYA1_FULL_38_9]OGM79740.1 MAG: hypothetical protein A2382_03245 [Candidatus Woesebacteria bacterium RIFOXYB1_FULL_38_16]